MLVGLLDVPFISRLENGLNFFIAAFVNCAKQVAYDHCFSITFDKNYHVHVAAIETFAQWSHREIEWPLHQYSWVGAGFSFNPIVSRYLFLQTKMVEFKFRKGSKFRQFF